MLLITVHWQLICFVLADSHVPAVSKATASGTAPSERSGSRQRQPFQRKRRPPTVDHLPTTRRWTMNTTVLWPQSAAKRRTQVQRPAAPHRHLRIRPRNPKVCSAMGVLIHGVLLTCTTACRPDPRCPSHWRRCPPSTPSRVRCPPDGGAPRVWSATNELSRRSPSRLGWSRYASLARAVDAGPV